MKWTNETPTQEGWYWAKNPPFYDEIAMQFVCKGEYGLVVGDCPWDDAKKSLDLRAGPTQWAGPIEPPSSDAIDALT